MNQPKSIQNSSTLIEVNKISNLFRVEKLSIERTDDESYIFKAKLYSDEQSLSVTWLSKEDRNDLSYGVLVRGVWLTKRIFAQGTNIIHSLKRVKSIGANESIANTVMPYWIYDGFAYEFIFNQIEQLPIAYRRLVMQVLSSPYVLHHFLKTPFNLEGDSCKLGSNFQKTAELVGFVCKNIHAKKLNAQKEVLITAALLLGIGHYNKFKFDHQMNMYYSYDLTNIHDPKIAAIGLVHKAAERSNKIELDVINRVIAVIDNLACEF